MGGVLPHLEYDKMANYCCDPENPQLYPSEHQIIPIFNFPNRHLHISFSPFSQSRPMNPAGQ